MEPTNGALEDYLAEVYLDGNGTTWTDEIVHYEPMGLEAVPYHAGMQDMALIDPNTILLIDVVSKTGFPPKTGWQAEGIPLTVTRE